MTARAYYDSTGLHVMKWSTKLEREIEVEHIPLNELPDESERETLRKNIESNWS